MKINELGKLVAASVVLGMVERMRRDNIIIIEHNDMTADCNGMDYNDAIIAIMKTNKMYSGDKERVMNIIKRDGDHKYYENVMDVVNEPSMYSCDKIKIIERLSRE